MRRLFLTDRSSKMRFFVDIGTDVSVSPVMLKDKRNKLKFIFCAANDTPIATFGQKHLQLNFALCRNFKWPFYIAEVSKLILGRDFLSHFNLLDIRRKRLINGNASLKVS